ncbi:hypothetical protein [Ramlibacter sp.]|uniref:hypothetical protein n=1 Tax=Ramlibacter sp. TaxID=1917967 RepID=UPI002D2C4478|nr:hypothetical protein [Ramlibacter sp.]HYD76486.1 hypothetical protein [Ramlibacter sp.]
MKPEQFEKALQEWDRAEDEAVRLEAEAFRQSRQLQEGAAATVRQARESRRRADQMLAALASGAVPESCPENPDLPLREGSSG